MTLRLYLLPWWCLGLAQALVNEREFESSEHVYTTLPSQTPIMASKSPNAEQRMLPALATKTVYPRAHQAATTNRARVWINGVVGDGFPPSFCGFKSSLDGPSKQRCNPRFNS